MMNEAERVLCHKRKAAVSRGTTIQFSDDDDDDDNNNGVDECEDDDYVNEVRIVLYYN